jgi:hypothetical protein
MENQQESEILGQRAQKVRNTPCLNAQETTSASEHTIQRQEYK